MKCTLDETPLCHVICSYPPSWTKPAKLSLHTANCFSEEKKSNLDTDENWDRRSVSSHVFNYDGKVEFDLVKTTPSRSLSYGGFLNFYFLQIASVLNMISA